MTTIHDLLRSLNITGNYCGYHMTVTACQLLMEDEMRFLEVTKLLYPDVAKIYGRSTITVERNIRTVIYRAWDIRRERLCEIAGFPLTEPPKVSEFLDMLISYIRKSELEEKQNSNILKTVASVRE